MKAQSVDNRYLPAFWASILVSILVIGALQSVLMGPAAAVIVLIGGAVVASVWLVLRRTVMVLGIVLAIMPLHFLAVSLGQFYGLPHMTAISAATKEIPLLLISFILWRRNGLRLRAPDWFLLAFFAIGLIRSAFGGGVRGFIDDFGLLIPYAAGKVTVLTDAQERLWAKCAVWIAAVLSAVGMAEVFLLGDGPRRVLYAVVSPGEGLPTSYYANDFEGLREASTTAGPLLFGAFCMVALIIWWVYFRNPLPAGIIFAGLICTLTRSAWAGTAIAILLLALRMGQKKRLASYALLGIIVFVAAIPILGMGDYLFSTRTGQDTSEQVHSASLLAGLEYVGSHPMGSGAESVGPRILRQNAAATHIESSYLILAAQYGLFAGLCFVGFLLTAIHRTWKNRTPLGYAAAAILMGFGTMMFFLPIHQDFRLNSWVWFPVGLAVSSAIGQGIPTVSGLPQRRGGETA